MIAAGLGALALLAPTAPLLRLFGERGFRRRLALFPRARRHLLFALAAYALAAIGLAAAFPGALVPALVVVLVAGGYVHVWRARPRFGHSHALPPGSLAVAPLAPWRDPAFHVARTRRLGPVYKVSHVTRPMVCINRMDLIRAFVREHEEATRTPPMPFNELVPQGFMRYLPPRTYADFRAGFGAALAAPATLDDAEATARGTLGRCLARLAARAEPFHPAAALHAASRAILLRAIGGVDEDDASFARAEHLLRQLDYRRARRLSRRRSEACLDELSALLLAPPARACGVETLCRDERLGALAARHDACLGRNLVYVLVTGSIDVADLLVWIWYELVHQPACLDRVAAERVRSGRQAARIAARRVVHETLRVHQSEYLMRETTREIRFAGHRIPRHWLVRLGIAEAHRDPDRFDDPEAFRPERFADGDDDPFFPFGLRGKTCLGSAITVGVGQGFVEVLARAPRWTSASDGPSELGAFHWQPSSRWRITAHSS